MATRNSKPTLADVGKLVGVSAVTVSNVINRRGGTSAATQAKVWAAIERTGYVADLAARRLAGGKTNTVGIIAPNLATQYASEIVRGISERLSTEGMELLLSTTQDVAHERRQAGFLSKLTDGLLFLLPYESDNDLRSFNLQGQALVAIEYRGKGHAFPAVNIDDYKGAFEAIGYLASLGHRRIGFIGGPVERSASQTRLSAYRDALAELGLALEPQLIMPGDFTQPTGFAAARALLRLSEAPTAIFAANDPSAFGAVEAVKDRGLRVPEDVSVVGFDDIPMASQVFPALTTVRRPLEQMGTLAVELLLAQLGGEAVAPEATLPTQLVVRSSTAPPRDV